MSDLTFDDLSQDDIDDSKAYLTQFLAEEYPSMDLSVGGVYHDLLLQTAAIFHALNVQLMDQLRRSMSLAEIEADPTLADDEQVDNLLSNYLITRDDGALSAGNVVLIFTMRQNLSISAGTQFTTNGLIFATTATYVGVLSEDQVSSTYQRVMTDLGNGTMSMLVPVQAAEVGPEYNISQGTQFTVSPAPASLILAYAEADFVDGAAVETNEELISRVQDGISAKILSGRGNIESLFRTNFPAVGAMSIMGFGDAEMIRDRHNIFSTSQGGKADIYLKSSPSLVNVLVTKTATLINADEQLWQLTITRDDLPGFYDIASVLPSGSTNVGGSLEIVESVRGLDLSGTGFIPDIANITEGAFTRYQTAVVQFIDTETDTTDLIEGTTTQDYDVTLEGQPQIAELQDYVNADDQRNPCADYLVRATVPCIVGVEMVITYPAGGDVPDVESIQALIAETINGLDYTYTKLPASLLIDVCHNLLPTGAAITLPITMVGVILKPGGGTLRQRSGNAIEIPELPEEGVSKKTTLFFAETENISITTTATVV